MICLGSPHRLATISPLISSPPGKISSSERTSLAQNPSTALGRSDLALVSAGRRDEEIAHTKPGLADECEDLFVDEGAQQFEPIIREPVATGLVGVQTPHAQKVDRHLGGHHGVGPVQKRIERMVGMLRPPPTSHGALPVKLNYFGVVRSPLAFGSEA